MKKERGENYVVTFPFLPLGTVNHPFLLNFCNFQKSNYNNTYVVGTLVVGPGEVELAEALKLIPELFKKNQFNMSNKKTTLNRVAA
jgi:hypothetical protein